MDPVANRIVLAILLFALICNVKQFASIRPETKNRFHLDRFSCTILNREKVKSVNCGVKHISWSHLKLELEVNSVRPVQSIWLHAVLYHKFNGIVYNKFPIDLWENLCEFIDGKRERTFFLSWWLARVQRFSNFNHSCPYSNILIRANNVTMDEVFSFNEGILPSGRYRVDISVTENDRVPFLDMKIFENCHEAGE